MYIARICVKINNIYIYIVYLHTCLRTIMISTVVVDFCRIIPIWPCQEPKWPEIGCTLRCHQTWLAGKSLTNGNVKLKSIYKKGTSHCLF